MTQLALGAAPARPGDVPASPPAGAPPKRPRLAGVDAARGVSLLGMISLHALYEADAAGNPTWSATVFSGRAAAAFALLAGVGIAFLTGRRPVPAGERRAVSAMIAVRALAIAVIGFLLCSIDTVLDAVILPYYGMVFLLAIPLVFLRTWIVAVIGVLLATVGPVVNHVLLPHLPEPVLGNPTFTRLVEDPVGMLTELSLTGFYPSPAWLAYMCAGIVIGRMNLTNVRVAAGLLAGGTVLAVWANAISVLLLHRFHGLAHIWAAQPSSGLTPEYTTELLTFGGDGNTPSSTWWWLAVNKPHTSTPLDLLHATGCAVAVLGLLLLAGHVRHRLLRPLCTALLVPLAAAGSMTLTFYSAHILFINSEFDTYSAAGGCLVQVIGAVLIALAVRGTVGRGPLELAVTALATRVRRWTASGGPARVAAVIVPSSAEPDLVLPSPAEPGPAVQGSVVQGPVVQGTVLQGSVVQGTVVPSSVEVGSVVPSSVEVGSVVPSLVGSGSAEPASARSVKPPAPRRPHHWDASRRRIAQRRTRPGTGQSSGP
ncbi:heparan-alpha-glucosaminide N-acetyltransferase domain-containing protein [Dactylosporangium sp. NPDC049525]|uniref:heparan-alpha-glucosaminide N-acetyltransferase domain-containing protein n=1 Tax=Dactylosporangium sp. NPDC049525 TaxID=3154730 RepID=UPI00343298DC